MKEGNYIIYGLLILVIAVLIFAFTGCSSNSSNIVPKSTTDNQGADSSDFRSIDSGTTEEGDVLVELTPVGISNNQLRVEISANTHSVSLGEFDLTEITILEYNGKSAKPVSAPNLGGHHSNGELVFDVDDEFKEFTIKIKGIPKVEERVFEWP